MQKLAHNGDDDGFGRDTASTQTVSKSVEDRVATHGNNGGHVEGSAQGNRASTRDGGLFIDGRTRDMMTGVQTSKGDELTSLEGGQIAAFSQELANGEFTQARNGDKQI